MTQLEMMQSAEAEGMAGMEVMLDLRKAMWEVGGGWVVRMALARASMSWVGSVCGGSRGMDAFG